MPLQADRTDGGDYHAWPAAGAAAWMRLAHGLVLASRLRGTVGRMPAVTDRRRAREPTSRSRRSASGPWPGVVVLHEAFGLNDDIRQQADRLASAGYVAVALDLYSRGGARRCIKGVFQRRDARARARRSRTSRRAAAGCRRARTAPGRVGRDRVLPRRRVRAAHRGARLRTPARRTTRTSRRTSTPRSQGACPVVASYGAKDRTLRGHGGRAALRAGARRRRARRRRVPGRRPLLPQPPRSSGRSCASRGSATTRPRRRTPGAGSCGSSTST